MIFVNRLLKLSSWLFWFKALHFYSPLNLFGIKRQINVTEIWKKWVSCCQRANHTWWWLFVRNTTGVVGVRCSSLAFCHLCKMTVLLITIWQFDSFCQYLSAQVWQYLYSLTLCFLIPHCSRYLEVTIHSAQNTFIDWHQNNIPSENQSCLIASKNKWCQSFI